MAGSTYSEKLRDPRWQRKRLEILGRDGFSCRLCGAKESTLHVHHQYYTKGADPWDYPDRALLSLCEACHTSLHADNLGPRLLQALIAGGAHIIDLYAIVAAFEDGFAGRALAGRSWDELIRAIDDAVQLAIRDSVIRRTQDDGAIQP